MTEAQFQTFVKNQLRGASWKWAPISEVMKDARVTKGVYLCAACNCNVPTTEKVNGKRIKNVFVDHILPIIDPETGFTTWDDFINKLYCEKENLQVLCGECHDRKTAEERTAAVERRKREKENNE